MTEPNNQRLMEIDISRTELQRVTMYLTEFIGTEGISMPFSFELTLLSETHNIDFTKIIGKNVTVSLSLADGSVRFFNGIISRFSQGRGGGEGGGDPRFSHYRATLVPWFWLLSRYINSRIFQDQSVRDIVEKVFIDRFFFDYDIRLEKPYEKRTYCVQYRETDLNFISRLLEEEGIYYFFEHKNDHHTLVLADVPGKHLPCPNQEEARYQTSAGGWSDQDVVTSIEKMQEIRFGKYTLRDFNFETPNIDLSGDARTRDRLGPGEREIYDYPGKFGTRGEGSFVAYRRMEEEEAKITTIPGSSVCRAFASGYRFKLKNHYRNDMNDKEFVLTYIDHEANQAYSLPGSAASEGETEFSYRNQFACIPFDIPFRPPRRTEKPFVRGLQTARVAGLLGEEIYTDQYGRVKVKFHWDREGSRSDDKSSCWIRVGQLWAGLGWGTLFIPRVGDEVLVDFLEGDPDRPIIVGSVYNGDTPPLYPLPDEKTKTTIKTKSYPDDPGFNEIRFEDKKGQEEVFIHAEKNLVIQAKSGISKSGASETISIGGDRKTTVKANDTITVEGNRETTIQGNETLNVTGPIAIKGDSTITLEGSGEIHIKSTAKVLIEAPDVQIKGSGYVKIESGGANDVKGNPVKLNC